MLRQAPARALESVGFAGHSGLADTFPSEIDRSLVARADAAEVRRPGKVLVTRTTP
jgi:hypothetical protein